MSEENSVTKSRRLVPRLEVRFPEGVSGGKKGLMQQLFPVLAEVPA
jgi:hypothetical protein